MKASSRIGSAYGLLLPKRPPARFAIRSKSSLQRPPPLVTPKWSSSGPRPSWKTRWRQHYDNAKRDHPIFLPVLAIFSFGSMAFLGLLLYDDYKVAAPRFVGYPPPVEQKLRLALHHTHIDPDPQSAAKYFVRALKEAEACGMDRFSKEFMGIRIRYSEMLEKFGHVKAAVDVLDEIVVDCEKRLVELNAVPLTEAQADRPAGVSRQAILRWIIELKVKASGLYESDYLQNPAVAKKTLSEAVGLIVEETKDPQSNGFTENNAAGLSLMEISSILSQMGDLYATSGEEANAVQVYMLTLQPLRTACNGTRSCKEVQILSNIASTMDIAMKKPNAKINGKPITKDSLVAARRATLKWADQAIATAEQVPPEVRDDICELGLLSAQMTRADLLFDSGDRAASRETFSGLLPTLRERGLTTLVKVAEEGMKKANT